MCNSKRIAARPMMMAGFFLLAVANLAQWWLRRHSGWPETAVDFTSGSLLGVAIATLLLALILRRR